MHPKFILFSYPDSPLVGTFIYGMVGQHKELVPGYGKVHGGGWYQLDTEARTITLYGSSGDYGPANLAFLNRIPSALRGYQFYYSPVWPGSPGFPGSSGALGEPGSPGSSCAPGSPGFSGQPGASGAPTLANPLPLDGVEWF